MSKGSLAVIILAVLLVLSMVLGLTGAWFTDKASKGNDLTFGKVTIKVTETTESSDFVSSARVIAGDTTTNLMPGDKINLNGFGVAKADGSDDFYYVIEINVAVKNGETAVAEDSLTATQKANIMALRKAILNTTEDITTNKVYNTKDSAYAAPTEDVVLDGDAWGNEWQGLTLNIGYEVRAVQMANVSADTAANMLNKKGYIWTDKAMTKANA